MKDHLPLIAIVGEPNAGKSTLLNKIAGGSRAVTSPVAGTTRDRQYLDSSWNGVDFSMVDTAGITFGGAQELENELTKQIDVAIDQADMIILVVDGKSGTSVIDRKTILKFRKIKRPIVLAVNKLDSPRKAEGMLAEFQSLGVKPMFSVSATTGRGIGDMLDYVAGYLKEHDLLGTEIENPGIGVAIVGKPNVGKSSIFNAISKEERVIVSPIPGTTRTAIDTHITYNNEDYTFIDTAGLKKKEHRQSLPDVYSGFQTFKAIRRSDIAFLVIDATQEITKQDQHIAAEIIDLSKGVIIVANKYDEYEGDEKELRDYISHHFPFLWFAPLFFASAKTGEGLDDILKAIKPIYEARHKTATPEELKQLLDGKMRHNPPKLLRDQKPPKVYGLNQLAVNPPLFELVVNHPAAISKQFRDAIKKSIMKQMEFWGTPINLILRGKDNK
jgi:GTP-binding protein